MTVSPSDSSDDEFEPESEAVRLLQKMSGSAAKASGIKVEDAGQGGVQRLLSEANLKLAFDTSEYELHLKQQAALLVERRQHEINAYNDSLHMALSEVRRVRLEEEQHLAGKVVAAQEAFATHLAALQQQFRDQVSELERSTLEYIAREREECEVAIAARVRALGGDLIGPLPPGGLLGLGSGTQGTASTSHARTHGGRPGTAGGGSRPASAMTGASPGRPGAAPSSPGPSRPTYLAGRGGYADVLDMEAAGSSPRTPGGYTRPGGAFAATPKTAPAGYGPGTSRPSSSPYAFQYSSTVGAKHGTDLRRTSLMLGIDERTLSRPDALHKAKPHVLDLLAQPRRSTASPSPPRRGAAG